MKNKSSPSLVSRLILLVVLTCTFTLSQGKAQGKHTNTHQHADQEQEQERERERERCLSLLSGLPDFSQGGKLAQARTTPTHYPAYFGEDGENRGGVVGAGGGGFSRGVEPSFYFFLHIPRCAGRTLHFCLLKTIFPPKDRCLASYKEKAVPDRSPLSGLGHSCKLQGTHDDLSILQQLPDNTAVFTQLRNPLDRVLSAYEFAVEVAVRNFFSAKRNSEKGNPGGREREKERTATDQVWPWSDLVPIVMKDFERRRRRAHEDQKDLDKKIWVRQVKQAPTKATTDEGKGKESKFVYFNRALNETRDTLDDLSTRSNDNEKEEEEEEVVLLDDLDPYNNSVAMPLAEFIQLPEVHHLLHNNELFQILGITNISKYQDDDLAREIRLCAIKEAKHKKNSNSNSNSSNNDHSSSSSLGGLQDALLGRGKRLVDKMWHVSVFDDLEASHASLCTASGWDLGKRGYPHAEKVIVEMMGNVTEQVQNQGRERLRDIEEALDKIRMELIDQHKHHDLYQYDPDKQEDFEDARNKLEALWKRQQDYQMEKLELENDSTGGMPTEASQGLLRNLTETYLSEEYKRLNITVREAYKNCVDSTNKKKRSRQKASFLKKAQDSYGRQIVFSKESRQQIPQEIIDYILHFNQLDHALYKYAKRKFEATKQSQSLQSMELEMKERKCKIIKGKTHLNSSCEPNKEDVDGFGSGSGTCQRDAQEEDVESGANNDAMKETTPDIQQPEEDLPTQERNRGDADAGAAGLPENQKQEPQRRRRFNKPPPRHV